MKFQVTILLLASLVAFANGAIINGHSKSTLAVAKEDDSPTDCAVGVTLGDVIKFTCTSIDDGATFYTIKRGGKVIYTSRHFTSGARNQVFPAYSHTTVTADVSPIGGTTSYTCQIADGPNPGADSTPIKLKVSFHQVEPDTIDIFEITSTSARVTWKAPRSDYSYSVSIRPTMEGAKVEPNPVPRGTTTVTLNNLTPRRVYQITIFTVLGATIGSQSKKSFQTPADILKDVQLETLSTAGLAVAVTCLVIIIILIVLIVILFRTNGQKGTHNGNDTHIPMSNMAFERDHQPRKAPIPVVGKSSEFKTWLLSKQISEDTYEVIQREGFDDPAVFAFLKPDEVSRLAIRPMAQELILKAIVESFNKGETPFQTSGTAGDELYDDVTNEKYEHLRVA